MLDQVQWWERRTMGQMFAAVVVAVPLQLATLSSEITQQGNHFGCVVMG